MDIDDGYEHYIEGSVTQRSNSIFCQNEEKCGLSRKHKDLTPLKSMASET